MKQPSGADAAGSAAPDGSAQPPVEAAPGPLEEAKRLSERVAELSRAGRYDEGIPLARRALELREKALGPEHPEVANAVTSLAALLYENGDDAAAEPLYRRALAIYEKALGPEHPYVAITLNNLAFLLEAKGDSVAAEPLYRRALAIWEKVRGPEHPDVANTLTNLALLLQAKGSFAAAEPLYRRALAIEEKAFGPEHPDVAIAVANLAEVLRQKGDYAGAEALYRRALAIWEKVLGPEHSDVARSLNGLANVLVDEGNYAAAEPLFRRALAIWEKTLGPEDPDVAIVVANLAGLLRQKGDYAAAESLYRRALATQEKVLGPEHPDVADSLNGLALLLDDEGNYAAAEPLYRRALAIREKALGPEHPDVASSLNNLALFLDYWKGDYAAAEPLFRRALAIEEKALGPEHPTVANTLNNLGFLLETKGDYAAAEPLLRRALAIWEKALGPEHPDVTWSLNNLADLLWARGAPADALPLLERAAAIHERVLGAVLATSSERQKQAIAVTVQFDTDRIITFHVRALPDCADAARLALAVLLQRKGRVLDAMTDMLGQLRRRGRPEDQAKLAELASRWSELATRTLRGPLPGEDVGHYGAALAKLRADAEALEQDLAARYKALAAEHRAVTLETVQAALGAGAALVEIALFQPFDPRAKPGHRYGDAHYVAYVLHPTGDPSWVALGPAAPIDALVDEARTMLSAADPRYAETARKLDALVMAPVRALLGETREVYLSPDGSLNLMPFAALVDEHGQFLLAHDRFTYLTSGRDLLRLEAARNESPRSPPLVLGNPAYDAGDGASSGAISGRRSADMGTMQFGPLPGTETEAREVAKLLPRARLLLGKDATESAVKALVGPSIVHLATHGFFLAEARPVSPMPNELRGLQPLGTPRALPPLPENPLLRSGLALAGANLRHSDGEDGVLTALEVTGLDLWGTKLVVLSACETGVGKLSRGEGVYGLRRALVLAGADSLVMSLWKVDDAATQALMTAYYERLSAGAGRSDALREVQLAMAGKGWHPYYWAAFIAGGSGRSLSGKEPPEVREAELPRALDTMGHSEPGGSSPLV